MRKMHLKRHMQTHEEDYQKHECETCGKKFSSMSGLKHHLELHGGIKKYQCNKCPKAFPTIAYLNRHNRNHVIKSKEKTHSCDICSKNFYFIGALRAHLKSHGISSEEYQCDACDKKFNTRSSYNDHIEWHSSTNYNCDICDKKYESKARFRSHLRSKHEFKKCEVCDKHVSKSKYSRHLKIHSELPENKSNELIKKRQF